jgi:hypothetical protein
MLAALVNARPMVDSASIQAISDGVAATLAKKGAAGGSSAGAASSGAAAPAQLSPEQAKAVAHVEEALAGILRHGHITRDDVLAMRQELAGVGPSPELDAIRERIAAAVNRNELAVDDPHFIMP